MTAYPESGFGFRPIPDARDKNYPMALILDPLRITAFPRGVPEGVRHHIPGRTRWLQGATGTCVEHGWRHLVEGAPIRQILPYPHFGFYRTIILRDEWNDNDFEANLPIDQLQSGTSVRAGAEQLKDDGLISNYLWASTHDPIEDIRSWILVISGVVAGLPWHDGMMTPDSDELIHYSGPELGGHCVYFKGWTDRLRVRGKIVKKNGVTQRAVRLMNSWVGFSYAWLLEDDLARLMVDGYGECCAPTEVRVKPLTGGDNGRLVPEDQS